MTTVINVGVNLREFNQGMQQVGAGLKGLGASAGKAMAAVGAAVVGVGVASLRAGEDANNALSVIAAQTGVYRDELRETELAIRDLSTTTGAFSAQQMRNGLASISRYGQDTEFQIHMVESAMRLAQASGSDFGTAIGNLDALMVKFNADLQDAVKFTNMFATAQGLVNLSQGNLTKGLQRLAPVVNAAGLSYEFAAGALALMYQEGISVVNTSNGMANVFNHMLDPASEMATVMNNLGISAFYATGEMRDQETVMWQLVDGLDSMTDYQRGAAMAYMQLSQYGIAFLDNMRDNREAMYEMVDAFGHGIEAGYGYERVLHMIRERGGGFAEAFVLMRNMAQNVLYVINDIIGARFYEWITDAAYGLGDFIGQAKENGYIEKMAESIMQIAEAGVNLIKEIKPIAMTWLPKLIDVTVNVTKFLGENADVVIALWAAFKGYKVVSSVIGIFNGLKTAAGALKGKKAIGGLAPAMSGAVGAKGGKGLLGGAGKLLKGLGPKGWAIKGVGLGATAAITWFRRTDEEGNTNWSNMTSAIGEHATNIRDNVTERIGDMARGALSTFQNWTGLTDDEMRQARDNVTNAATAIRDNVTERFSSMRDSAVESARTLANNAREVIENSGIGAVATSITDSVRSTFQKAGEQATSWGEAIGGGVRRGIESMRGMISDTVSSIGNMVGNTFRNIMGINSPSRVTMEIGEQTGEGYQIGLLNMVSDIENAAEKLGAVSVESMLGVQSTGHIASPTDVTRSVNATEIEAKQPIVINTYLGGKQIAQEIYEDITELQHHNQNRRRQFNGRVQTT